MSAFTSSKAKLNWRPPDSTELVLPQPPAKIPAAETYSPAVMLTGLRSPFCRSIHGAFRLAKTLAAPAGATDVQHDRPRCGDQPTWRTTSVRSTPPASASTHGPSRRDLSASWCCIFVARGGYEAARRPGMRRKRAPKRLKSLGCRVPATRPKWRVTTTPTIQCSRRAQIRPRVAAGPVFAAFYVGDTGIEPVTPTVSR
jgi:hypothetical protein